MKIALKCDWFLGTHIVCGGEPSQYRAKGILFVSEIESEYLEFRALQGLTSCRKHLEALQEHVGEDWKKHLRKSVRSLDPFQQAMDSENYIPPLGGYVPDLREFARALKSFQRHTPLQTYLRANQEVLVALQGVWTGLCGTGQHLQLGREGFIEASALLKAFCLSLPQSPNDLGEMRYLLSYEELAKVLERMGEYIGRAAVQISLRLHQTEETPVP